MNGSPADCVDMTPPFPDVLVTGNIGSQPGAPVQLNYRTGSAPTIEGFYDFFFQADTITIDGSTLVVADQIKISLL